MKTITRLAIGLTAAAAAFACSKQPIPEAEDTSPPIVREAKAAFAAQFSATKSSTYTQFNPGTITPDWEHALIKDSNRIEVQIAASRSYKAFRKQIIGDKTRLIATDVHQSLTARKNKQGGVRFYLLTLIPDAGSMFRDGAELLHSYTFRDDSGGFTGLAIYSTLEGAQVQLIEHTPTRTRDVWFADTLPIETLLSRAQILVAGIRWKELDLQTKGRDGGPEEVYCEICQQVHSKDLEGWCIIIGESYIKGEKPINELLEEEKLKDNTDKPGYWDTPGDNPDKPGDNPGGGNDDGGDPPPPPPDTITVKPKTCIDLVRMVANPMEKMILGPPNPDNPKGALFGNTRINENRESVPHDGIDLAAPIGTPIYAAHSGIVVMVVSNQVNRIGKDKYPPGYKGNTNNAGNRIYINFGNGQEDAYWHLQEGTPIAINPRTGQPFKKDDRVELGEVIGYSGLTGNANVNNVPHLHYGVRINGEWRDPFDYIPSTVNQTTGNKYEIITICK